MTEVFFTGFPGFLGSELLPRVLERSSTSAVCLIQPKFAALAHRRMDEITAAHPGLAGRIRLLEGDITRPGLGLESPREVAAGVSEIYHLAAIYDLEVRRDLAMRVNVEGTKNLLAFAADCPSLERFQYVSTCYVSGRYAGIFREDDLDKGQVFNNYYEETKFLAEIEVQARREEGLPTTIYRPAITVGDSTTGATQKFDGPYYIIQWLLRQPKVAVLPVVGDPTAIRVNVVPSDFVVDAIAHLSGLEASRGQVYQLADPEPLTVDEMLDEVARATSRWLLRMPLPRSVARNALEYVPFLERFLQIPPSAIDYFVHPTHYTSDHTQRDLEGSGIAAPPFSSYVDKLVRFMKDHPEVTAKAMV